MYRTKDFRLIPKEYSRNKIVFVVTWNEKQYDIDSQLFSPNGNHLYFKTLSGPNAGADFNGASLDRDDTDRDGRETTIITLQGGRVKSNGSYRFLAFQYVKSGLTFQQAGVSVDVYRDGSLWKEIKPSAGSGRLWYVANVDDDKLNEINQYPAGDLYLQMDKLQTQLKDNQGRIENQAQRASSLEFQAKTNAESIVQDEAELQSKRNEWMELTHSKDDPPPTPPAPPAGSSAVAAARPAVANPSGIPATSGTAPVPAPVASMPAAPVPQPTAGSAPDTAAPPLGVSPVASGPGPSGMVSPAAIPAGPKPETPAQIAAKVAKEINELKAKISREKSLGLKLSSEAEQLKTDQVGLAEKVAAEGVRIQAQLMDLDRKLEDLLKTYQ